MHTLCGGIRSYHRDMIVIILLCVSLIFAVLHVFELHPRLLPLSWAFAVCAALVAVWK